MGLLLIFTLTGCSPGSEETEFYDSTDRCSYSGELVFTISADIDNDFDDYEVQAVNNVETSTCNGVNPGDTATTSMDRIQRTGNTLTFTEGSSSEVYSISGDTFTTPTNETVTSNGKTFNFEYSNPSLVSTNDTLTLNYSAVVTGPLGSLSASKKLFIILLPVEIDLGRSYRN